MSDPWKRKEIIGDCTLNQGDGWMSDNNKDRVGALLIASKNALELIELISPFEGDTTRALRKAIGLFYEDCNQKGESNDNR